MNNFRDICAHPSFSISQEKNPTLNQIKTYAYFFMYVIHSEHSIQLLLSPKSHRIFFFQKLSFSVFVWIYTEPKWKYLHSNEFHHQFSLFLHCKQNINSEQKFFCQHVHIHCVQCCNSINFFSNATHSNCARPK